MCVDNPEEHQSIGHTANVEFFEVSLKNEPDKDVLKRLINEWKGEFNDVDLFDGEEHGYMEIGGWIGDQGAALVLMGTGELLGLWTLLTPTSLGMPKEMRQMLAGHRMVTIKRFKK